jgi:hypothetical protein
MLYSSQASCSYVASRYDRMAFRLTLGLMMPTFGDRPGLYRISELRRVRLYRAVAISKKASIHSPSTYSIEAQPMFGEMIHKVPDVIIIPTRGLGLKCHHPLSYINNPRGLRLSPTDRASPTASPK